MSARIVFEIREPGKVPIRKLPYGDLKTYLRELLDVWPRALITVVEVYDNGEVWFSDAPEYLEILDRRQRFAAARHRRTSYAAFKERMSA